MVKKQLIKRPIFLFLLFLIFFLISLSYVTASGCYIDWNNGNPGCKAVKSWGSTNIDKLVRQAAKNNPGTAYMGWCPNDGATPYAREVIPACNCPNLNPKPGECVSGTCGACGNPVTKCSPEQPPQNFCGDGIINGNEKCEYPNTNNNQYCSQSTETCNGKKLGLRDNFGDCNSQCGCNYDNFNFQCVKGKCGAECSSNNDCDDGNPITQDICNANCGCEHKQTCVDECKLSEKKCVGNKIYSCGNFDTDPCLEWGFKQDCFYEKESNIFYECRNDDSVSFKYKESGFCRDAFGNNDYCDSKSEKVIINTEYCGTTKCTKLNECKDDSIFEIEKCTKKGCDINNGKCYSAQENKIKLKEDCGQDNCISFTDLDVFKQEYVEDYESCTEGNSYCNLDLGKIYDVCINDKILNQAYCNGNDHSFKEFDCSTLSGCYDFTYTQCVYCNDEFGNCEKTNCQRTGKEYRQYYCGSGSCKYFVLPSIDKDKDRIDDRCDFCIDIDKDGICDDKDNCLGLKNSNQVDKDNDGLGDECDNDRDNDGYTADVDCNDWNSKINPGMKEMPNNNIDDDCNSETSDREANLPREMLYVDIISEKNYINNKNQEIDILVSITNNAKTTLKNIDVKATFLDFQENQQTYIYKLEPQDTETKMFRFNINNNEKKTLYLRVTITSQDYKRIIYREII
ncbi:MAG: hypothetical protein QXM96_02375 [Candidatus Woesearchaeota archaeon]